MNDTSQHDESEHESRDDLVRRLSQASQLDLLAEAIYLLQLRPQVSRSGMRYIPGDQAAARLATMSRDGLITEILAMHDRNEKN
jgi:hypothetical protein